MQQLTDWFDGRIGMSEAILEEHDAVVKIRLTQLQAMRREIGCHIDPETAELGWCYGNLDDPYGDGFETDDDEAEEPLGRIRFARSPGGVWIEWADLPHTSLVALLERIDKEGREEMFFFTPRRCRANTGPVNATNRSPTSGTPRD